MAGTTQFVAVMSDDSDFIALYAKLRQLTAGKPLFLWVVTDRANTRLATSRYHFPSDHIHVVITEPFATMADLIIERIPIGLFKSTDCRPIIKEHWPDHPIAEIAVEPFGARFSNEIWPLLEKRGVKIQRLTPRRYEMTAEAKATK